MVNILLSFSLSLLIVYVLTPHIIHIANLKNLFDEPGARKLHTKNIPRLGGLAVFISFLFSTLFFMDTSLMKEWNYLLCATLIIFAIGFKDDIIGLSPGKKFAAQIIATFIVIYFGDVHFTRLHGILGFNEVPLWVCYALTAFTIIVITNAFNLIDGINGLVGMIGFATSVAFGVVFYVLGHPEVSVVAFAISGGLIGFLRFNMTPAKVFMGDTGSLLLGFMLSILAIKFIELNHVTPHPKIASAPVITIAILAIPLFDTLRVFTLRILKGHSPFHADRNHIHHLLIDCGFSHTFASLSLLTFNIFMISIAFAAQDLGTNYTVALLFVIIVSATYLLTRFAETFRREKELAMQAQTQVANK